MSDTNKKIISLSEYKAYSTKDFEEVKNKKIIIEIRLKKEEFLSYVEYKKENFEDEDDSDNYLCNMIGESLDSCTENLKDLSKPLMNAHLIWYFFWEYSNGGLNQVFYNSMGDYAPEIADALMDIGLKKESKVFKNITNQYYKEMNKEVGKIIDFRNFLNSYEAFDLSEENEVFIDYHKLYKKADKYLMKNMESFCI